VALSELFDVLFRWAHVIAAIMWIGDSFLFMWLDSQLRKPDRPLEGDVVGELRMAHSGGFYEVVKRKSLTELRIGDAVIAGPRVITLDDIEAFAALSGDTFYAHMDDEAARANPFFEGRVAHGYFVVSLAAGLFVSPEPGPVLANVGLHNLTFSAPVYPGDALTVALTAKAISPRVDSEWGDVTWDAVITNQDDHIVATYDVLTSVAKTWPAA
jgi:acyl dehydratase